VCSFQGQAGHAASRLCSLVLGIAHSHADLGIKAMLIGSWFMLSSTGLTQAHRTGGPTLCG
jgi:hypothetical protein